MARQGEAGNARRGKTRMGWFTAGHGGQGGGGQPRTGGARQARKGTAMHPVVFFGHLIVVVILPAAVLALLFTAFCYRPPR